MSFATFFRTLPETLQQPAALAMLGSIGAHLLVFATLPAFTSSTPSRPEAELRRIQVVDPPPGSAGSAQTARSQLGLPPVPNTPTSKVQIPIAGLGTSSIPNPLYTIPDSTPIPVPNPPQTQPSFSSQDRFNELLRRIALRQQQQQQAQASSPQKPPVAPSPPPTIAPGVNLKPFDPSVLSNSTGTQSPATSPQATKPSPAPTYTPQTPNDRRLAETRYIAEGTTQEEGAKVAQGVLQQLNDQKITWDYIRLRQPQEPIRELDYPLPFALQNYRQHPVSIAVFIGKDGKPIPDRKPTILTSTGYQILNNKAIEIVQNEISQPDKFKPINEDKIRIYVYEFQFKAPKAPSVS